MNKKAYWIELAMAKLTALLDPLPIDDLDLEPALLLAVLEEVYGNGYNERGIEDEARLEDIISERRRDLDAGWLTVAARDALWARIHSAEECLEAIQYEPFKASEKA